MLSAARFWYSGQFSFHTPAPATSAEKETPPLPDFPIKRALISGDSCPAGVITALEQLLGTRLFPHYGSRETGLSGAITCPAHSGMHLKENHVIAEILDEAMQPVADGDWGELVITTIGMEAMPLIRYRTGDRARFLPSPCPCGSPVKRLDMVSRRDPASHLMETMDSLLFSVPEVIDYQAVWEDSGLHLHLYSISGHCRTRIEQLLPSLGIPVKLSEKKCLPECSFLYPGKRFVCIPHSIPLE